MLTILFVALLPANADFPAVSCPQPSADLGELKAGPVAVHRFALTNKLSAGVKLTAARSSCGCLEPRLSADRLAPGESAELEMRVNTLSQPAGPNAWSVRVRYSGGPGNEGELELRLTARLVRELTVEPAALVIHTGERGITREVTLTDRRQRPLELTAVRTTCEAIRAEAVGAWRREGGAWVRTVRVEVAAGAGRADGDVCLYGADPDYRELRVPVSATRRAARRVSASPEEVTLAPSAGRGSCLLLLRDAKGEPVEVEKAECDDPAVSCRWAEGAHATAAVRLEARADGGDVRRSVLRVRLKAPAAEVLEVPLTRLP
jgi:Protein of unknown function (DUF1573)